MHITKGLAFDLSITGVTGTAVFNLLPHTWSELAGFIACIFWIVRIARGINHWLKVRQTKSRREG